MEEKFWLQKWHSGEIGFHQYEINPHLIKYWPLLDLSPGATVFVPLCGKSSDMLWLAEQGYQVIGVELSELAVEAFFAESNLLAESGQHAGLQFFRSGNITIYQGDFFTLSAQHLVDVLAVFDRAALIALPEPMRKRYVQHLQQLLPTSATLLLIALEYHLSEMSGPPFCVAEPEVETLFAHWRTVERLARIDALEREPKFRERGLTSLDEAVFMMRPPKL